MPIAVVVGMKSEAALVAVQVVCSGGVTARAEALARRLLAEGASGLLSFGIAGGLAPALMPGAIVVGTEVDGIPCDPAWTERLHATLPEAVAGPVRGVELAAASPEAKAALRIGGALAVDMESGAVARVCQEAGKPFAVLRAVADPYDRGLPVAALSGLDGDGNPRPFKVMAELLRRPSDLPGLIRVALDSRAALLALGAAARRLGPALGHQPA
ncbi:MAG: nucleoside phosphorylase [Actinomycetota bacterium]